MGLPVEGHPVEIEALFGAGQMVNAVQLVDELVSFLPLDILPDEGFVSILAGHQGHIAVSGPKVGVGKPKPVPTLAVENVGQSAPGHMHVGSCAFGGKLRPLTVFIQPTLLALLRGDVFVAVGSGAHVAHLAAQGIYLVAVGQVEGVPGWGFLRCGGPTVRQGASQILVSNS